ncbi:MAG: type II secretion system inner membrane protein GspF [Pseudomonadota bacterium]|nr:type II secretion system inner membrane protein GspF [Pseudomonadota bacterium]
MTTYRYSAFDAAGKHRSGELEADSPRAARAHLREQGLLPRTLGARDAPASTRRFATARVSSGELALFSRQFATLLHAGLTIERALAALLEQPEQNALRAALTAVREDVLGGHALGAAFARQARHFPRFYAAIVQAGEESGALPGVMERLADYLERGQALRQKISTALVYPAIVAVVACLVVGVLLTYVVPQMVSVFEHSRQALPWLTRAMLAISDFLRATWWAWLLLPAGGAVLARRLLAIEALRLRWHGFLLGLPLLGSLRSSAASARFANTLAVLVGSGVPIVKAFAHAGAALDDRVFRRAVENAAGSLREGMGISRALRQEAVFPGLLLHLVASGEASGELARVLEQAAKQQEASVETRLTTLTALLEPLLILAMGGMVMLIVLATLQPIIEMNHLLH